MSQSRWFPAGAVASPHHLASAAGQAVLADGGNAVDAAVAANLVLAVVTPYHCGVGGDLLAIVWDGQAQGVLSVGRAPMGATPEAIGRAIEAGHGDPQVAFPGTAGMPMFGALPVTVPGATAGWFHLLERWGSRSFGELSTTARRLAADGFPVSAPAASYPQRVRDRLGGQPGWEETFGHMRVGERFVQPELAATLTTIAEGGPAGVYTGRIADAIVSTLQAHGSTMTADDLAAHTVAEATPLAGSYRGVDVLELPPPTQGVTSLTVLGILDALGPLPEDPRLATHLQLEAVRLAMADRQEHLADPEVMRVAPDQLLSSDRLRRMAADIDPDRVGSWPPPRPAPAGTAYLCAADADGLLVSLIQSNFVGFGSGVVVPGTGIGLQDRGAHFSRDADDPAAIGPGRQPVHTLIPGLALRDGRPWLVFGTMGGDAQPQIHLQLLSRLLDRGDDVQAAIDAPRFVVDVADGAVRLESRASAALVAGLTERGHQVTSMDAYDRRAGHAYAIEVAPSGYVGGSDPRTEGAVTGC